MYYSILFAFAVIIGSSLCTVRVLPWSYVVEREKFEVALIEFKCLAAYNVTYRKINDYDNQTDVVKKKIQCFEFCVFLNVGAYSANYTIIPQYLLPYHDVAEKCMQIKETEVCQRSYDMVQCYFKGYWEKQKQNQNETTSD